MKKWIGFVSFCYFMLGSLPAEAAIDPAKLIKATVENNPKCVEYFSYKGEMYCSTTAQSVEPVDPHIKDYEKQKIVFDDRVWQAAWGQQIPTITTVEYVPNGDDIEKWHELVTSQFVPGLPETVTPKQYADVILKNITEAGFKPIVTFIEEKPDQVIFEYRIESPSNLKQDVLEVIRKASDGFYLLHYDIKEADMGQKNRDKWLSNLKMSKIS